MLRVNDDRVTRSLPAEEYLMKLNAVNALRRTRILLYTKRQEGFKIPE